jgi:ABC-2 type transport system ATP-binding protein
LSAPGSNQHRGPGSWAVTASNLTKVYSSTIRAVDDVTFSVGEGEIFGLLGPNGAGKTTVIKMIATLAKPTSGSAKVFGVDVRESQEEVRSMLGYVPQNISADLDLSAYENLLIYSKLFHVGRSERKTRIQDALVYMGLDSRAHDVVKHFSGGMVRRLEIAQTLVNRPRILFLDEPTIGLDPNSKRSVWESVIQLKNQYKTTVFITTHDMVEAETLCDRIAIMDVGKIMVSGSPESLKKSVGGETVSAVLSAPVELSAVPADLGFVTKGAGNTLELLTSNSDEAVPKLVDLVESQGVKILSVSIRKPDLGDVFVRYTNHRLPEEYSTDVRSTRRAFVEHSG